MNSETTPAPAPEKQKHNKLEMPQQFKLLDWCRQNEDKVKTLPDPQLAQIAEAELGFKITVPNLTSVRQAAGIEKLKPTAPPTIEERLNAIEKAMAYLIVWANGGEIKAPPAPFDYTSCLLALGLPVNPAPNEQRLEMAAKIATGSRHLSEDKLATGDLAALGLPGLETPPLPVSGAAVS